jgi:hypothetical protein
MADPGAATALLQYSYCIIAVQLLRYCRTATALMQYRYCIIAVQLLRYCRAVPAPQLLHYCSNATTAKVQGVICVAAQAGKHAGSK